ncbi:MFP1 attachment factor 1-like [Aristolochia californica]|uniref:MFP1 attachment factor 1-like n=1 Tax=Aristolochia californica TaxID=171875 RepID=UPI0035E28F8B
MTLPVPCSSHKGAAIFLSLMIFSTFLKLDGEGRPRDQSATTMAVESDQESLNDTKPVKDSNLSFSFSIWPPSQRTRDAVVNRLVETLSAPSVLSKRYGSLPPDEAAAAARIIEDEAFAAAASRFDSTRAGGTPDSDDAGIEVLQFYSKEISKRMLDAVKARANASSPADNVQTPPAAATSEEISSLESESSQA